MKEKETFILIVMAEAVTDGFSCVGPFETHEDAASCGEYQHSGDTWWVVELANPEDKEDD